MWALIFLVFCYVFYILNLKCLFSLGKRRIEGYQIEETS